MKVQQEAELKEAARPAAKQAERKDKLEAELKATKEAELQAQQQQQQVEVKALKYAELKATQDAELHEAMKTKAEEKADYIMKSAGYAGEWLVPILAANLDLAVDSLLFAAQAGV